MKKIITFLLLIIFVTNVYAQNITRNDAVEAINQSELDMKEMMEAGFSVNYVNDTLISAKQALERADFAEILRSNTTGELANQAKKALEGLNWKGFTYDEVINYTNKISSRKEQSFDLSDSIRALELKIGNYKGFGVSTSEAKDLLNKASTAFKEERYEDAEYFLLEANSNLEEKVAELTTLNIITETGKGFLEKYWFEIIIFSVFISIAVLFNWIRIKKVRTIEKIKELKAEQKTLMNLMKEAQIDRYKKAEIPESIYNIKMRKYRERLTKIKETIPVLEAKLKKSKKKNCGLRSQDVSS